MGVPKFFRWLSERYPAISQLITENHIPEFDCLYFDMNGIIHNCTHNDDDGPTFRMTEDKMFISIFNYIEHLFGKIKPKKLFFMAIDGVAPRAKMNQQRARRFRTALGADMAREKALRQGIKLPNKPPFDSNCITPGTEFMAKLTRQLKYFINKKVTEDAEWQGIEIVLSGHEVPGEGEHKIMEYIRLAKAQPEYDPNVRHCLYGLDADLIMLGLLSHDPHFCLLREEVTFGRRQKKSQELEHQNFYLMHLSVVREYLEHEFQELKQPGVLGFPFDLEQVIDDFILLAFFVGNDFLPNLPKLQINEGALSQMFGIYKTILPKCNGYINQSGFINLDRLELLLQELEVLELTFFESECSDTNWFKGKQTSILAQLPPTKSQLVLSSSEKEIFNDVNKYVKGLMSKKTTQPYDLPISLKASERKFVQDLASALRLQYESILNDDTGDRHIQLRPFPTRDGDDSDDMGEGQEAISRVLNNYQKAPVVDLTLEEIQAGHERKYQLRFAEWRDKYYQDKLGFSLYDEKSVTELAESYVQGLQWVLFYYYRGVASWPWFYKYHYAPKITDVRKGLKADMNFKLGKPFKPFEQLMGVLPDRSKELVPIPYWELMTSKKSPIIDFYPREFALDQDGKAHDWEAVILIPFIDENRLLAAMATQEHKLTEEEKTRNSFNVTLKFSHDPELDFEYPSSYEGVFPPIQRCTCVVNTFELPAIEGLEFLVGLCDGVKLGKDALAGFPSLRTIPHTAQLGFHGVNVFRAASRNESMVLTLVDVFDGESRVSAAKQRIGQRAFVGYPFLQEALVTSISDELFKYVPDDNRQIIAVPHGSLEIGAWKKKAEKIEAEYSKRFAMVIGPVEVVMHVAMLKGLKRTDDGSMVKDYAVMPGTETDFAAQTIVYEVASEDQRFLEQAAVDVTQEFPLGSRAFYLGDFNYGRPLQVCGHLGGKMRIFLLTEKSKEPQFKHHIEAGLQDYIPSYQVARMLGLNPLVLSKITSSFSVMVENERQNLGLNLKFEAKKLKVIGYSRKRSNGWEFSQKAIELLRNYLQSFPEFFQALQKNPQGDIYQDTDFYPENVAKEKMEEIKNWLKSVQSKEFEKVPLEAEQLDGDVVKRIEAAADEWLAQGGGRGSPMLIRNVPRKAILKPSDAEHCCSDQIFAIGDRAVYVQDSGKVPIGSRGTVIGLTQTPRLTLLDIVWDETFMSGTTLGDRCSPFRGMTVPVGSVLNVTNRQVVAKSAASVSKHSGKASNGLTSVGAIVAAPIRPSRGGHGQASTGRSSRGGTGQQNIQVNGRGSNTPPTLDQSHTGSHRKGGSPIARGNSDRAAPTQQRPPVIMRRPPNQDPANPAPIPTGSTIGVESQGRGTRNYQRVPPPGNLNRHSSPWGRGRGTQRGGDYWTW